MVRIQNPQLSPCLSSYHWHPFRSRNPTHLFVSSLTSFTAQALTIPPPGARLLFCNLSLLLSRFCYLMWSPAASSPSHILHPAAPYSPFPSPWGWTDPSCSPCCHLYLKASASVSKGLATEELHQRHRSSFTPLLARALNALDKTDTNQLELVRKEWSRACFTCSLTGGIFPGAHRSRLEHCLWEG